MSKVLLEPNNVEDIIGLSPMQLGILYHYVTKPESDIYLSQLSIGLVGEMDTSVFQKAVQLVTKKNEILRAVFRWEGLTNPVQIVLNSYEIPFSIHEIENNSFIPTSEIVTQLKGEIWSRKIDICEHPVEIHLCKTSNSEYELIIQWHHILYDGWSNGIFIQELLETYDNLMAGKRVSFQKKNRYAEFIRFCQSQDEEKQDFFWNKYLSGFEVNKTIVGSHIPIQNFIKEVSSYSFKLPIDIKIDLESYLKNSDTTLANLMYTVWAVLLYKLVGNDDVLFGQTVSGRNAEVDYIDNIIGLFINTLPLRVRLTEELKISEVLNQIEETQKSLIGWETTSLSRIKNCSDIDPNISFIDSLVVIENYPLNNINSSLSKQNHNAILTIQSYEIKEATDIPLVLGVIPHSNQLTLQYNSERFTDDWIQLLSSYVVHLLKVIISTPNIPLSEIELILDTEKEKMSWEARQNSIPMDIDFNFNL